MKNKPPSRVIPIGPHIDTEELFTVQQAAQVLGCSSETVRRMIHTGKLPGMKLLSCWAVRKADIYALANKQSNPTPPTSKG